MSQIEKSVEDKMSAFEWRMAKKKQAEDMLNAEREKARIAEQTSAYGVTKYDPVTGCWPNDAVDEDGRVKPEALEAYIKEMNEKTIPAIVETMQRRAELAQESRNKFICA